MRKSKILILLVLSIILNVSAQVENITINSVKDVQAHAIEKNTQILNSRLDQQIAKKKIWETTTIGLPQINGKVDYNNQVDIPTQVIPAAAFDPTAPADLYIPVQFGIAQSLSAGITLTQLIFDGSYFVGLRAAKAYAEFSEKEAYRTEVETKYMVTRAYYTYLSTKENEKIMRHNIDNLKKIFDETAATYEVGLIEELDKDRVELSLNLLEDQYKQVQRMVYVSLALLKFQIGFNASDSIIINDSIQNYIGDLLIEETILEKPDYIKIADYQSVLSGLALSELDMKRYKAQRYPSIGGFFTHSQNGFGSKFDFFESNKPYYPTTIVGLSLKVPIFSSFGQSARISQAKLALQKTVNQKNQIEQKIEFDFIKAKSDYMSAKEQLKDQKKNLELAQKIYDKTIIKQREGVGSSIELNNAESKFFETQSLYINALHQLLLTKTDIDKAVGNYNF